MSDLSSIKHAVARCAGTYRQIQAAYIFGSVATGRTHANSDVDVAVLLDRHVRPAQRLKYRLGLMADVGSALQRSDVEVVILNEVSPLLAHRVLSRGILAFERSRSARVQFQVRTAARYLDLIPIFESNIRYLKRNARRGKIVG